ncbi:F-box family protein [Perilla frutescens var. hirtella]|uniref:F-box family protein n=1 Tax=Perilla frutescens var. hirtella TaxID=608512 RepID=A0AAD4P5W3_PERFH|nr:F-box family protein [Perilla frutescens var. hirtella]
MKQKQWPRHRFTALPLIKKHKNSYAFAKTTKPPKLSHFNPSPGLPSSSSLDLSAIPYDALVGIAAAFTLPDLRAASLVCRAWRDALKPLREAMVMFKWGKRFKHGRGGVKPNLSKALENFLKAAARGSILAMVDAGLIYWEMGKREDAILWYTRAAELGDPAGQCNLAISFLQANPPNTEDAIQWLYKASTAGHARAQYQLALCLHRGQGMEQSLEEAACWYARAADGGYARAMYNTSLCYSLGEGLGKSNRLARKWMRKAADHGHSTAQYEHGLALLSEGDTLNAAVYLELATRAGEMAAVPARDALLEQLSATWRDRVTLLAHKWRALPSSR